MIAIESLLIPSIDVSFDANYIMDTFYCQDIATISSVTIIPCDSESGPINQVYIVIHEWHPTEVAYNFIQRLKDPSREAKIVHTDDDWWAVEINENLVITTMSHLEQFRTVNYLVDTMTEVECLPWLLCVDQEQDVIDWRYIEKELSEMNAYQNLEYELCL